MAASVTSDESEVGAPQQAINEFWENLITKKPAKVTKIFPSSLYAHLLPSPRKPGTITGKNAADSYQAAADECRVRVKRIVRECERTNEKFTDPDFDIEDLTDKNCLEGLTYWYKDAAATPASASVSPSRLGSALSTLIKSDVLMQDGAAFHYGQLANVLNSSAFKNSDDGPGSVHRVDWIFDKPQFEIDGFSSSDVVQGSNGDCWFIAAVATICSNPELIRKVCVERNEECGVYGFVFYRDGEWIWTVVDDNLYLKYKDFDAYGDRYDPTGAKEAKYRKNNQTGSTALYFGSCADEDETWLPLLEKAYAKVHGDFAAISGGWSGEAVEDLTGGVTTKILTDRILSKNRLWEELLLVNKQFLFSASSPGSYGDDSDARRGLALSHAYSVLKAVDAEGPDGKNNRLVLIRNPWGKRANAAMGEWTGPWSDGSSEWSPYWMEKLGHKFGDDGLFWMSYEDMLMRFDLLDRTRLFDEKWTVVQQWTSVSVAWVSGYLNTKFSVEIKKPGPTVFVLCQLDDRYFQGLEGKYDFDLHFILQEKGATAGDHIVRARGAWFGNRSISAEVDLEAGIYEVIPKIEASRDAEAPDVGEVVIKLAERNPQKLRQIGLNYDIANAKGWIDMTEEERKKKEQKKKEADEEKKKKKEAEEKEKADFEAWKQEEKEEYEAWKKEKQRREKKEAEAKSGREAKTTERKSEEAQTEDVKTDEKKEELKTESPKTDDAATLETKENDKLGPVGESNTDAVSKKTTDSAEPSSSKEPAVTPREQQDLVMRTKEAASQDLSTPNAPASPKTQEPAIHIDSGSSHGAGRDTHDGEEAYAHANPDAPRGSPSVAGFQPPPPGRYQHSVYGDAPPPPPADRDVVDSTPKPWNAVCVLGLRVYSQDEQVSIKLVKPKDVEEGAILDVDGDTPAGATM